MTDTCSIIDVARLYKKIDTALLINSYLPMFVDYTFMVILLTNKNSLGLPFYDNKEINVISWTVLGTIILTSIAIFVYLVTKIFPKTTEHVKNKLLLYEMLFISLFLFMIVWCSIGIYLLSEKLDQFSEQTRIPKDVTVTYFCFLVIRSIILIIFSLSNRRLFKKFKKYGTVLP